MYLREVIESMFAAIHRILSYITWASLKEDTLKDVKYIILRKTVILTESSK
jgi:hypothetical protein